MELGDVDLEVAVQPRCQELEYAALECLKEAEPGRARNRVKRRARARDASLVCEAWKAVPLDPPAREPGYVVGELDLGAPGKRAVDQREVMAPFSIRPTSAVARGVIPEV